MRMMIGQVQNRSGIVTFMDCWALGSYQSIHRSLLEMPLNHGDIGSMSQDELQILGVNVPKGDLQLAGERSADNKFWRYIDLIARNGTIASVEKADEIIVNNARILFADADALDAWQHHDSLDGQADVAFWGRDQDKVAAEVGAPKIGNDTYGWENLPVEQAEPKYQVLVDKIDSGAYKFMADYRPHNHHYLILDQMRKSPLSVGHVQVAGQFCFGLFTHGDGVFPVLALRDAKGTLLGVRIDLMQDGGADVTATGVPFSAVGALPPDPMTATKNAMTNAATDMATSAARKAIVGQIKGVLPKFLHPLIPGEKGTVAEKLKKMVTDYMWEMVISAVITVLFFAVFAAAIVGFLLVVLYAVLSTLMGM